MKHYKNLTESQFSPDVWLYQRTDVSKQNWYARIKLSGRTGHVVRSTKKTDFQHAHSIARSYWLEEVRAQALGTTTKLTFSNLADEFVSQFQASEHRIRVLTKILDLMRAHFGQQRISSIDEATFFDFVRRPSRKHTTYTTTTLQAYRGVLRQVLLYAVSRNYIPRVPPMTTSYHKYLKDVVSNDSCTAKGCSPEWFGRWQSFLRKITKPEDLEQRYKSSRLPIVRLRALYYVSYWSLIRPSTEITGLKWRDVTAKQHKGELFYVINVLHAKNNRGTGQKTRVAILPVEGARHLLEWENYCRANDLYHPQFPVFSGKWTQSEKTRGEAPKPVKMTAIRQLFRKLLAEMADWKTKEYPNGMHESYETARNAFLDHRGRRITFYSAARSTSITNQLRMGRPISELAELAGTSVQMIESHYRAEINASQASRYARLQSHKPYYERYRPKTVLYDQRKEWTSVPQLDDQVASVDTLQENETTRANETEYDWDSVLGYN
jgi:hypothetical protein